MSEPTRRLSQFASDLHAELRHLSDSIGTLLVDTFHYLALFALGATTVWSAVDAFLGMMHRGHAGLGDLLLLFIYLEIRSEEHTSELQSHVNLVCRLLLEKKK